MIFRTIAVVAVLFANVAKADEREPLAEQYVALPVVQKMIDDMFSPDLLKSMIMSMVPAEKTLEEAKLNQLGDLVSSELDLLRPHMVKAMIEGAATQFTADELRALIAFYQTPEGASVMAKMQPYMQQTMAKLGPAMADMQSRVQKGAVAIMTAKE